jgi:hypothetical protein
MAVAKAQPKLKARHHTGAWSFLPDLQLVVLKAWCQTHLTPASGFHIVILTGAITIMLIHTAVSKRLPHHPCLILETLQWPVCSNQLLGCSERWCMRGFSVPFQTRIT